MPWRHQACCSCIYLESLHIGKVGQHLQTVTDKTGSYNKVLDWDAAIAVWHHLAEALSPLNT